MTYDPLTRRYCSAAAPRRKTKTEAIRCLERDVARELYAYLPQEPAGLTAPRSYRSCVARQGSG